MKRDWTNLGMALLAAAGVLAGIADARAQTYPEKPIRLVVGFAPNGGTDTVVRSVVPGMAAILGQPINVENAVGGEALNVLLRAPADGYTLMAINAPSITVLPVTIDRAPYTQARDLVPVGLVASLPYMVVVPASMQADSLQALVNQARARPGHFTYYSTGTGSVGQLVGELFKSAAGVDLAQVVYKSERPAREDLGQGLIGVSFEYPSSILNDVRGGRLRALAVASAQRVERFPNVPTTAEAGLPNFRVGNWTGLFAPKGTPPGVVARVHAALRESLAAKEVRQTLERFGAEAGSSASPEEFAALVRADAERFGWAAKVPLPVQPR